jgi:hypothetical protein
MAPVTINDKPEVGSVDTDDFIPVWVAGTGVQRKAKKAAIIGALLTGGGTIATGGNTLTVTGNSAINGNVVGNVTGGGTLATGGFTGTLAKTGTVPVGTGTAGRVTEWSGDSNTLAASTLAKTGAGVLTLSAASAYTMTVPATGTAALLDTAQTFTGVNTFAARASLQGGAGWSGLKASVAHNVSTNLFEMVLGGGGALSGTFLLGMTYSAASRTAAQVMAITWAYDIFNTNVIVQTLFNFTSISLVPSITIASRKMTISVIQQNSGSAAVAVNVSVLPLQVYGDPAITFTML